MSISRKKGCVPYQSENTSIVVPSTNSNAQPRFHILFESEATLVIDKQPGVLTQAPMGVDSVETRVKDFLNRREGRIGKRYLGPPHRLDRPASGVLMFAKTPQAARFLSAQFEERSVSKKYWALVAGRVPEDMGRWIDYMRKIPGRAEAELVPPINPDAREAILRFEVLERLADATLLEIQLDTGRTHQIRLQCSSRGFPILGDELYGSTVPFGERYEDERERAIALHARELTFVDFQADEKTTVQAPLYRPWKTWLDLPDEEFLDEMFLKPEPVTTDVYGLCERKSNR